MAKNCWSLLKLAQIGNEIAKKPTFECEKCKKSFTRLEYKKRHIDTVHEKKKPYNCPVCPATFGQKIHMKEHCESIHERKEPFQCKECDRVFAKKGNLTAHKKTHEQDRKFQFNCEICNKYGSDHRSNFERHMKKHKNKLHILGD